MLLVVGGALLAVVPLGRLRLPERHRGRSLDEVRLLTAVLAALRAGHSLRSAIGAALEGERSLQPAGRLARLGAPIADVGRVLARLPTNGKRVEAALKVLEMTGGKAAAVFDRLLTCAAREADLARERRQLTAQARASAFLVAALPVVATVMSGGSQLVALARSGTIGLAMTATGVLLQAVGLVVVWRMAR